MLDKKKGIFLSGAVERDVGSPQDAFDILETGNRNRRVASTAMNRESSRSHAVFTLHVRHHSVYNMHFHSQCCSTKMYNCIIFVDSKQGSQRDRDQHACFTIASG